MYKHKYNKLKISQNDQIFRNLQNVPDKPMKPISIGTYFLIYFKFLKTLFDTRYHYIDR